MPLMSRRRRTLATNLHWLQQGRTPRWLSYSVAVVATVITAIVRAYVLQGVLGPQAPLLLLIVPVIIAGFLGGFGPAVVATLGSVVLGDFLLLEPTYSLQVSSVADRVRLGMFLLEGVFIAAAFEAMQQRLRRATTAESDLRDTASRLNATFDTVIDGVITIDEQGVMESVNPAALRIFGYSANQLLGRNISMLMPEPYRSEHDGYLARYKATSEARIIGHGREVSGLRSDGTTFPMELAVSRTPLHDRLLFTGVIRDISQRRQAQQELRTRESHFRQITESMPDIVYVSDADGGVRYLNERWTAVTGLHQDQGLQWGWHAAVHPDDLPLARSQWEKAVSHGRVFEAKLRLRSASEAYHWYLLRAVPLRDTTAVAKWFGTMTNIHEQVTVEHELRELTVTLEEKVAQRTAEAEERAYRLRRLTGALVEAEERERRRIASVLHDSLQQLLAAAKMQLSAKRKSLGKEVEGMIALLDESLSVSRTLVGDLSPPVIYEGDMRAVMNWVARRMLSRYGLTVHVHVTDEANGYPLAMRVLCHQVALELLFNVVKHAGTQEADLRVYGQDNTLCMTVEDRGKGFDAKQARQRSTDRAGLGLFSLRERVELVGGRLDVRSQPDQGTRVSLCVPLPPERPQRHDAAPVLAANEGDERIRIVIVDDHRTVRESLATALEHAGMRVVGEAGDGHEAIDVVRQLRPDVVLMDITMPGLDGVQATRQLKQLHPEVAVVGLSMHETPEIASSMLSAGAFDYLNKAVASERLLTSIRGAAIAVKTQPEDAPIQRTDQSQQ